jgi:hypothetical protein
MGGLGPEAKLHTHNGVTLDAKQWAKRLGISRCTFDLRLRKGFPPEKVFRRGHIAAAPRVNNRLYLTVNGVRRSLIEWAEISGVSLAAIKYRIRHRVKPALILTPGRVSKKTGTILCHNGISDNLSGWGRRLGVTRERMRIRLQTHSNNPAKLFAPKAKS